MFIELTQPKGGKIWHNVGHIVSFSPANEGGTFIDTVHDNRGKIVRESPQEVMRLIKGSAPD